MARFLATLHSDLSERGGIGIIDSDYGLVYLQVDSQPTSVISPQLRCTVFHEGRLYISTPATVLVYSVTTNLEKPVFQLERNLSLQEWVTGTKLQADLLGIMVSAKRNRLLVANNLFNSIDEFSLDGRFVQRHFLFEIAPELFTIPETIIEPFQYGHTKQIVEMDDGTVVMTVSSVNGGDSGCVLNFDTGDILLNNLDKPHGGLFHDNRFFIQEASEGRLSAYSMNQEGGIVEEKIWENKPQINQSEFSESTQNLRGMVCIDDSIYCGVCHWNTTTNMQIPPRIVSFDMATGRQEATEIFFPDLNDFREPRVFSLAPIPLGLEKISKDKFSFFFFEECIDPVVYSPPNINKNDLNSLDLKEKEFDTSEAVIEISPDESELCHRKPAIILDKVNLAYRRSAISLLSFNKQHRKSKDFQALTNISFTVYEDETVGIIGRNGSGKSTIAMLISGSLPPDQGSLTTHGRVQLLSIGLGFRNELSGRENVFLNGALLGLSKKEILKYLPEIEAFAELEHFMEEPVRTYSAGMRSRLGFAVATVVRPDILILDEVMSTGDAAFRRKADERMNEMRERTKTIILVSHSIGQVRKMCSRVIWLHHGTMMMDGAPDEVLPEYESFCVGPEIWLEQNQLHLLNKNI